MTRIIKIRKKIFSKKIRDAAEILKGGGLVAFPTETVYGLGANGLNEKAVKKIFIAKGRPQDNPLILHIAKKKDLFILAEDVPDKALKLIRKFWPGPLTVVLKKTRIVPDAVTAGLNTVAVRMPANKVALYLIKEAGIPVAAPSANLSGKPSPTRAEDVIEDLAGKIDIIIDAGDTKIGVESTVIDLTCDPPVLLRPGGVSIEELESAIGKIILHPYLLGKVEEKEERKLKAKSPGMKYKHYAPKASVIIIERKTKNAEENLNNLLKNFKKRGLKVGLILTEKRKTFEVADIVKEVGKNSKEFAKNLFKTLRDLDKENVDVILVEAIEEKGIGLAVMNRLKKAAGYKIEEL